LAQAIEPNVRLEWVGPHGNVAATYFRAIWNVGTNHVLNHGNWPTYYGWMMRYLGVFDSVFRDVFRNMQEGISPNALLDGQQRDFDKAVSDARADADARRARLEVARRVPERFIATSLAFHRNPDVVAEVLERASGVCENPKCRKQAPFLRASDNRPYLEVHHKIPLAQGGEDTVENAIALCPNCHREAHYGNLSFFSAQGAARG
jgi:hypothetical protein